MEKLEQHVSENLSITSRIETQSPKPVREYNLDPIPVDILIDIFSRLPRKSIDRFRCVSKSWRYLLRRPDFRDAFLTNSSTRPRLFFTLIYNGQLFCYSSPQPQNPDDNSTLVATFYDKSSARWFPTDNRTLVCGLALLQGKYKRKDRVLVFCNPITGKFITLPKVPLNRKSLPDTEASDASIARIYLGYDPISKKLKVLCMTSSLCGRLNTHQVLTLESGHRLWRRIDFAFSFTPDDRMRDEICINGVLYFGAKMGGQSSVIVCFDIRSEKFGFINLDEDMLGENYESGYLTLFNYKGKLGIREETNEDTELVLWVLEDAASHEWSKQTYEMPSLIREKTFVGMTGTGEIVWSSFRNNYLNRFCVYFYNLEKNTLTRVDIRGFEDFKYRRAYIDTFLDYVENIKLM
ncbi:unnamed protein product [Microthlaspi erraticum]|uniref:F-box domain-containing protein n=1 Tax=Microthlaspi erraticum TaxID=1685480 RepID=A0A6D2J0Y0_9BRAS|nr:unnamed protein product [Microthlaspi erraticum]